MWLSIFTALHIFLYLLHANAVLSTRGRKEATCEEPLTENNEVDFSVVNRCIRDGTWTHSEVLDVLIGLLPAGVDLTRELEELQAAKRPSGAQIHCQDFPIYSIYKFAYEKRRSKLKGIIESLLHRTLTRRCKPTKDLRSLYETAFSDPDDAFSEWLLDIAAATRDAFSCEVIYVMKRIASEADNWSSASDSMLEIAQVQISRECLAELVGSAKDPYPLIFEAKGYPELVVKYARFLESVAETTSRANCTIMFRFFLFIRILRLDVRGIPPADKAVSKKLNLSLKSKFLYCLKTSPEVYDIDDVLSAKEEDIADLIEDLAALVPKLPCSTAKNLNKNFKQFRPNWLSHLWTPFGDALRKTVNSCL